MQSLTTLTTEHTTLWGMSSMHGSSAHVCGDESACILYACSCTSPHAHTHETTRTLWSQTSNQMRPSLRPEVLKHLNTFWLCRHTSLHIHLPLFFFYLPSPLSVFQTAEGKPLSMVSTSTHLSHLGSLSAVSRGPLEPPKINKPWSLSCLRPAPPLKPSAALRYKEVGGCSAAQTNPQAWSASLASCMKKMFAEKTTSLTALQEPPCVPGSVGSDLLPFASHGRV